MFSIIDQWLARFRDPVTVDLDAADDVFHNERQAEIAAARDRSEELRSDCLDVVDDLGKALDEVAEFEDAKGRKRFNDVMENIVADRRRMLDQLDVPESPAELYDELDAFIEEFRQMSQKESAILEHTNGAATPMFRALDRVEEQNDRIGQFLEEDYAVMERYERLQELVRQREQLQEQYDQLQEELADIDIAVLREKQEQAEQALEELEDSDLWATYQSLQMELESAKSEQRQVRQTMTAAMGQMERGLKKLLYTAEHGGISLEVDTSILEAIRDREHDTVLAYDPDQVEDAVAEAQETLPDNLLDERQQNKFEEGVDALSSFTDLHDRFDDLETRINRLESKVSHHDAVAKKTRMEQEQEAVEHRVEETRGRKQQLKKDLEQTEREIELVEDDIEALFQNSFYRDVIIDS